AHMIAANPDSQVVAVCDVHAGRLAAAKAEFGGEKVKAYNDFRKLLENKDVDAVVVAPTSNWHVIPTIQACQAGKDVYVEKPLGRSIGEGRAAVRAARKYDRIVQIGTQQRSWEHYRKGVEIVRSGLLGDISEVKVWDYDQHYPGLGAPADCDPPAELDWDFYCGPAPRIPYNALWFGYGHYFHPHFGGSWHIDWAVHHYDIVHWAMGTKWPRKAMAMGGHHAFSRDQDGRVWPDTFSGTLQYDPCPAARNGFLLQYSYRCGCRGVQRSHSKEFFGTHGSMQLDRSGYTIRSENHKIAGKWVAAIEESEYRGPSHNHHGVFLENVRNHTKPDADVETGHFSTNPGHLMSIAYWTGRQIEWDGEKEKVIGDEKADSMVTRKLRKPWTLDV
ncbi:MAG: Gfo/Idh/MocA family protein, partial [Pirellulales bacterium]